MTPHIEAKKGQIAQTVIMPGDPLRAKFIAENFLTDAMQFNGVRGMLGFTGLYKGMPISVMGSGMGIPSMGIYSHELFTFYDVERIIRVGTAGGISPDLALRDIVMAMGACTNSSFMRQYDLQGDYAAIASYELLRVAVKAARSAQVEYKVGNVLTSDTFYNDDADSMKGWHKMGVLAVEMEAAGLYATAARLGKQALAILTISDLVFTHEQTSPEERQESFTEMMRVALDASVETA